MFLEKLVGIALITGAIVSQTFCAQATFYVSPTGSDNNAGTQAAPFATIAKARDAVRAVNTNMTDDIIIYLRGGWYFLTSTLSFSPADGGTNNKNVVYQAYPGEVPVISGGVVVTGWTLHSGNIYKATLDRGTKLRGLYVNGARASMARTTSCVKGQGGSGTFTITGNEPWALSSGSETDGIRFSASEVGQYTNPEDVEIYTKKTWNSHIIGVREITTEGSYRVLKLQQPMGAMGFNLEWGCGIEASRNFEIRNAFELLDAPGEFYFNKGAKTLYYFKKDGEDMATAEVIAPTLEGLIKIKGNSTSDRVKNIVFRGITFLHNHYSLEEVAGSRGVVTCQSTAVNIKYQNGNPWGSRYNATKLMSAAVELENCSNIRFERNQFEHILNMALSLNNDASNCSVVGNIFSDISSSAVNVGHPHHVQIGDGPIYGSGIEGMCNYDTVKNNLTRDACNEFYHAAVICSYYTAGVIVANNDINSCYSHAINAGWGWGQSGTGVKDNMVINNRVVNANLVLSDLAPIYTLSAHQNSFIQGNYVKNPGHGYGAIYPDEGSALWTITGNVLETFGNEWLHIWTGSIHDIKADNNYTNNSKITNAGTNCVVTNTHLENSAPPWSSAAQAIINAAGLEPAYQDLLTNYRPSTVLLQAEEYNQASGASRGGMEVGTMFNNQSITFSNVNLGSGYSTVTAYVRNQDPVADSKIEVRLDNASGTLIGTINIANAGGWAFTEEMRSGLTQAAQGVHAVCIVCKSSNFCGAVDWLKFTGGNTNYGVVPTIKRSVPFNRIPRGKIRTTKMLIMNNSITISDDVKKIEVFDLDGSRIWTKETSLYHSAPRLKTDLPKMKTDRVVLVRCVY